MKRVEYVIEPAKKSKKRRIIVIILLIVIIVCALLLTRFLVKNSNAAEDVLSRESIDIQKEAEAKKEITIEKNMDVLDIKNILNENTKDVETKTLVVDEMDLDYKTLYRENPELPQGQLKTVQEGVDGSQQVIVVKSYLGNEYIGEERVTSRITKGTIDKIVEIGTGSGTYTYTPEVGDKLYVTPSSLTLREAANNKSNKVCVLKQNDEVRLVEISGEWYKVKYENFLGYAQANCFTAKNPNAVGEFKDGVEYSKEELLASLDMDMDLNKPSGFTLEQFKKVLSGNKEDKKHVIEDNAEYFYYAEKQYNINGIYLAAMAIHEGGWGTSKIAQDKKNLFGYGAYDSNPYGGAYDFETYSEGIDLVARVLVKHYLNEKGTEIYDGETATGKYYNGPNLKGVNKRYASDKNWANATFKWMKYLYERL